MKNLAIQIKEKKEILRQDPDFDQKNEVTPQKMVSIETSVFFEQQAVTNMRQEREEMVEDYKAQISDIQQSIRDTESQMFAMAPKDNRLQHDLNQSLSNQRQLEIFLTNYEKNKQEAIQDQKIF